MTVKLTPTLDEIEKLRQSAPAGPVVIVNLLKLRSKDAYRRYMEGAAAASDPHVEILYAGVGLADVGGGADWDFTIIARYRSFEDFARVVSHPAYQATDSLRAEALERTVMLVTSPADLRRYFGGS